MQSIIYAIDFDDVSDPQLISDYFFARAYGSSCFERNLQLLRRTFQEVSVSIVGKELFSSETNEKLLLLAKKLNFSLVSRELDQLPQGDKRSAIVIYQSGLALLTKFTALDTTDMEAPSKSDIGSEESSLLQSIKAAYDHHGAEILLCHVFPSHSQDGVPFILYRPQEAVNITSMGPDLVAGVKRHLEIRASQRSMDGPVSRLIVRHLCHLASKPLAAAGIHPNYVTLAGALSAFCAVLLFLDGRALPLAVGGVCWLIGGILDEADGEVARLQGKESTFGSWLDLTLDRVLDAAMLLALAWPLTLYEPYGEQYLIITLCALVSVSASSYTGLLYDSWMRSKDRHTYFRLGRDVRILIITLCALFGFRMLPIVLCGVFAATEIGRRFWVCWRVERSVQGIYE
ncbi:CDP-alcohol phosphatidyltransferase family protein [Agrobacterium tumefaciens]|uniref:CDP-alcohol phosphatidyltransferase family protein n=1 Tax=Agrobacterium tumefaciens TaxID=358 RepID=A0AA44JBS2_AGRTU|nr:CDP-alcohol phosphatidyltransferase family protein [Agrobacterium tumefaciens]NTB87756.1 CDP-alcohol phosphatidyltransferase family protein [Agrobacterium tumefaciens]NTC32021.1 CDP-alcohol phosphatidyltransferase family protein [Agrobacterium tumefaciens]